MTYATLRSELHIMFAALTRRNRLLMLAAAPLAAPVVVAICLLVTGIAAVGGCVAGAALGAWWALDELRHAAIYELRDLRDADG